MKKTADPVTDVFRIKYTGQKCSVISERLT